MNSLNILMTRWLAVIVIFTSLSALSMPVVADSDRGARNRGGAAAVRPQSSGRQQTYC